MRSLTPTLWLPLNTLILVCLYHYVCQGQHYVNIALLKTCQQSSTYGSAFKASNAVDNNLYTLSHTDNRTREWWEVDLGRNYHIKDIRIYPQPNYHSKVANTTIRVDSSVCARVPQNDEAVVNVSCENFMYGRRVRIVKDGNAIERYLSIAEFQVMGCQQGCYGNTCNQSCLSSYCLNNECDRLSGQCITCRRNYKAPECIECKDNWYGQFCEHECTWLCYNNIPCNKTTGFCPKCPPGFQGNQCNETCPEGRYGQGCAGTCGNCSENRACDAESGLCRSCSPGFVTLFCNKTCTNGTYGSDCVKACHCKDGQPCNVITGECIDGCAPGWTSKTCDQNCETGKYGQDCLQECGHCAGYAACKVTTGYCRSCTPGLNPPLCKDACKNGTYGGDCTKTCGNCKDGQPCNVITGECIDGCTAGWTSKTCDQSLVSFDVVIIAGAIIGGFLILTVSISVPLWLKRFKHRSVEESNRKQIQLQTSFNRRHLQAQADLPNPLETGVDYDDMGNPYDSLDLSVVDDDAKYTRPALSKIKTSTEKDTSN